METQDFLPLYCQGEFLGDLIAGDGNQVFFDVNPENSHLLPVDSEKMVSFLENLLPEGQRAKWYESMRRLKMNNVFGYIDRFGADMAGSIHSETEKSDNAPIDRTEEITRLIGQGAPLDATVRGQKSLLPGVDTKLAVIYENGRFLMPTSENPSTHIIKYNNFLCLNEHFCMSLLMKCGAKTAKTELLEIAGKEVLLIERFDRKHGKRIQQSDFCQLAGKGSGEKYSLGWREMARIFDKFHISGEDRQNFIRTSLFNVILGCFDDHAKNWSLLGAGDRRRLAPAYDIASLKTARKYAAAYSRLEMSMPRPILDQGHQHKLKPIHILALGKMFGLEDMETADIFHETLETIADNGQKLLDNICESAGKMNFDNATRKMHEKFKKEMSKTIAMETRFFEILDAKTRTAAIARQPKKEKLTLLEAIVFKL